MALRLTHINTRCLERAVNCKSSVSAVCFVSTSSSHHLLVVLVISALNYKSPAKQSERKL